LEGDNMGLQENSGMKAIWSLAAIVVAIFLIWILGSMSYLFPANTIPLLQYLLITFAIASILIIW